MIKKTKTNQMKYIFMLKINRISMKIILQTLIYLIKYKWIKIFIKIYKNKKNKYSFWKIAKNYKNLHLKKRKNQFLLQKVKRILTLLSVEISN
jgi:hypothetical protein